MMPMGVPSSVANPTITTEPKIAFARPPVSASGGGVISVKVASASPPTPRRTVSNRIHNNQKMPKAIAASDNTRATAFTRLRRA
jgi:hypothetical protein